MSTDTPLSDELIAKAQEGDEEAFGEIFEHFVAPLYRFVFFRSGDQKHAEQLTEETFLRVWRELRKFRPQGRMPFEAWVFQAGQQACTVFQERIKKMDTERRQFLENQESPDRLNPELEQQKKLARALQELPDTQAEAIILKYFCDLPNGVIAFILEKTEGAIRILQSRGLKRLRETLENT